MATPTASQAPDFNRAFTNLQTFVDHNATSNDPSIYRLVVANDNQLVSEQTCLFMRVIEMICAYVVNYFKVLFCCCWCVDVAKEDQQNLIKETLRQSLDVVNQAEIPQDRQDEFQRLQRAFNQIMGAVRDGQNDSCMNFLYKRAGWDITSDLSQLTIATQRAAAAAITAQPPAASTNEPTAPITSGIATASTHATTVSNARTVVASTSVPVPPSTSGAAATPAASTITTTIADGSPIHSGSDDEVSDEEFLNPARAPVTQTASSSSASFSNVTALLDLINHAVETGSIEEALAVTLREEALDERLNEANLLDLLPQGATPANRPSASGVPTSVPTVSTGSSANNVPANANNAVDEDGPELLAALALSRQATTTPPQSGVTVDAHSDDDSDPDLLAALALSRQAATATPPQSDTTVDDTDDEAAALALSMTTPAAVKNTQGASETDEPEDDIPITDQIEFILDPNSIPANHAAILDKLAIGISTIYSYEMRSDNNIFKKYDLSTYQKAVNQGLELLPSGKTNIEKFYSENNGRLIPNDPYPFIRQVRQDIYTHYLKPLLEGYHRVMTDASQFPTDKSVTDFFTQLLKNSETEAYNIPQNIFIGPYVRTMGNLFKQITLAVVLNNLFPDTHPLTTEVKELWELEIEGMIGEVYNGLQTDPNDIPDIDLQSDDLKDFYTIQANNYIVLGDLQPPSSDEF